MIFKWETEKERVLRGLRISGEKKLEAARLLNEFSDRFLSKRQKLIRQKLRSA
jgi:hypothetical protein